ncbi:class I SAM-dependent DNA methyltransferase [Oligoflexus tunisiensis]|uniref:class I SAM-dependent DNA methyltransferase n=1 Tax=Oligoflexus tunisiensis TaxID=708132 RepID=UPI000AC134A7|nr:class I SAM-dependent methyltransferase [Oligoflexus tunisiensis]
MKQKYSLALPDRQLAKTLGQDKAYFTIDENGEKCSFRFHDYDEIFKRPGLYEQLFHCHLRCASPRFVVALLDRVVVAFGKSMSDLNVLDLGAGNGMVGAELLSHGAHSIVGLDILPDARDAAERDRPGVYDAYYVADLIDLPSPIEAELQSYKFNCLVCIAALGFGDIPPEAFLKAFRLTSPDAWLALNLKDSFFGQSDQSGFSGLIKRLIADAYIQILHVERYRHRISVAGDPLYYYAFIFRKTRDVPEDFAQSL